MSSCFLFLVSLGRGRVLGLVWHLLCPVSRGVMSVTWYPCLSPTPHRLQVALVSFLPRLQSFSLSSLGALCSCGLFDSASPLSASSAPCSSSEKLRPQGHQYFRCVWWERDGWGMGSRHAQRRLQSSSRQSGSFIFMRLRERIQG